ncbi:MAG: MBL fold metallo-hydrolase [Planctomycetota bacterium]|nr:MAG: MBL fold metallo-hydrolase [Planctomycetota bacterium]
MIKSLRVVILGSGTSHGIPMIGCSCPVCTSDNPHDKRTRTSIVVEADSRFILIDASPELRLQCLACKITRIDAVLFTHYHADHVVGLDDLRRFNYLQDTTLTCYGDKATVAELKKMFSYAFNEKPGYPSEKPHLESMVIDGAFDLFGIHILPIPLFHGELPILGFRFGPFAYCTDCSRIPPSSFKLLEDLEVLVLDGLRRRVHPTHFNLAQAVRAARQIGAGRTYFTHITHELPHETTNAELPPGMGLAYDGQVIEFPNLAVR